MRVTTTHPRLQHLRHLGCKPATAVEVDMQWGTTVVQTADKGLQRLACPEIIQSMSMAQWA